MESTISQHLKKRVHIAPGLLPLARNNHTFSVIWVLADALYRYIIFVFQISWHMTFWGLVLQFVFGIAALRTKWGINSINYLSDRVHEFISHSDYGAAVFFGPKFKDFPIAFSVSFFRILCQFLFCSPIFISLV